MNTPAPQVEIPRYMGHWYVIASIATPLEKNAFDAVETYVLEESGTIKTTFRYRKGGFDGKFKTIHARGFVKDKSTNAVWAMQFIWPFKADYRIAWVAEAYDQVVIARQKRDYLWIMARSPHISEEDLEKRIEFAESLGYQRSRIIRVPQRGTRVRRAH